MTTTETVNPYPAVAVDSSSNAPGRASLVVGIVIVVLGVAEQVVLQLFPLILQGLSLPNSFISVYFGIYAALIGVLAIVGLILGIVGLGRSYAPRLAAAAGTAIAASSLLTALLSFVLPLLLGAIL